MDYIISMDDNPYCRIWTGSAQEVSRVARGGEVLGRRRRGGEVLRLRAHEIDVAHHAAELPIR